MKRFICLLLLITVLAGGCQDHDVLAEYDAFSESDRKTYVHDDGVEYTLLAYEPELYHLGELEFAGSVCGEQKTFTHFGMTFQTGMYAIKDAPNSNILIRYEPNNEWFSIYRKASLPQFEISVDLCVRLEYIAGFHSFENDRVHVACNEGITDRTDIHACLADVRAQKDPEIAGLYDLFRKSDGMLENCYICGEIYGFFAEEPDVAVVLEVTSYNDLAYSVCIEDAEYVLPEKWVEKLQIA